MLPRTFRPQLEALDDRWMPSANPALSISDVSQAEGQSGQTAFVFTVSLSKASSRQVSVNFATAGGSALAGVDFASQSGTLTFAPGEIAKTITVLVNGDTDFEGYEGFYAVHERFAVNLSGARRASIADATGVGTIRNDDPYPYPIPPGNYFDPYTGVLIPSQPPGGEECTADHPYYPNC
jgi:Calx-beta domain